MLEHGGYRFQYSDCEIAEKLTQFAEDQAAFITTLKNAWAQLFAALGSISSVRQLQEQWPEVVPLVAHLLPDGTGRNLPSVQFSKMNELYRIPPVKNGAEAS